MTGRPLDLTQRQVRAIAKGVKDTGCIAEVQIGKALVRLVPEDRAIPDRLAQPVDGSPNTPTTAPSAYDKWKAGKDVRAA